MSEVFKLIEDSGLDNGILNMIHNLSPKTDLSPKGFISFLQFLYDALQDFPSFFQKIFQVFARPPFFNFGLNAGKHSQKPLRDPEGLEPGRDRRVACDVRGRDLLRPFDLAAAAQDSQPALFENSQIFTPNAFLTFCPQSNEKELDLITREFNNCEIIPSALNVMKTLPKEHAGVAWSLLSRLVINHEEDKPFAAQFYNYQGLSLIPKFGLLAIENSNGMNQHLRTSLRF